MGRKCPTTLDKPILMFGLEVEDVGILGLIGGVGSILMGPVVPGSLSIVGWIVLTQFKKGKPAGFLIHWLYQQGMSFPGLVPPVKGSQRYGIYGKKIAVS